jgi:hypothetical protein
MIGPRPFELGMAAPRKHTARYDGEKEEALIRRFGGLALLVGALAAIIAWFVRRREDADVLRESYEAAREEVQDELNGQVRGRGQETIEEPARGTEEAGRKPREEMGDIIKESIRRSRGEG